MKFWIGTAFLENLLRIHFEYYCCSLSISGNLLQNYWKLPLEFDLSTTVCMAQ